MQLPITNVIDISAAQANPGVGAYNTSNLAVFTDELPLSPTENIAFSGVAASGTFLLSFAGNPTAAINWNDSAAAIQGKIQAVTGQTNVVISGSIASQLLTLTQPGQYGPIPLAVVSANSLQTSGSVAVNVLPVVTSAGWSGGASGYAQYLSPTQAGIDFGTASKTVAMANAVFSQQPNILAGGGQLVVILMTVASQTLTFSAVAASGTFVFNFNGHASSAVNWNDTPAQIQAKLQAVTGLSQVLVTGTIGALVVTVQFAGVYGVAPLATITSNTLETSGSVAITVIAATAVVGETWAAAITRTTGLVQYFGLMVCENLAAIGQTDLLAAAAVIQPLNKIGLVVSNNTADIAPGGMIDLLRTGTFTQTRGLFYDDPSAMDDIVMMASYAGRAFSVVFTGSNTTITMHLKQLAGVQPDPNITQTILNAALLAGADTYISLQGDPCVFCSGANKFFDQVYNLQWFVGALQVSGFNFLAQSATKLPQTESGMDGLKGAYRSICEQAVTNQYSAPGQWNSPTTFGNQADLIANVSQRGYYIYSTPISQQLQTARAARQAPLVQIALKEAGAIQSSTVIINVNA